MNKIKTVAKAIGNLAQSSYDYGEYPTKFTGYIPAGDMEWNKVVDRFLTAFNICDEFGVSPELQNEIAVLCRKSGERVGNERKAREENEAGR